jgi:hypothetical protein
MVIEGIEHHITDYSGTGVAHEITLQLAEYSEINPTWRLGVGQLGRSTALGYARPAFDPTTVAPVALWLRADRGVTLSGGNVSAWADQSGHGFVATPSVGNVTQGTDANGNLFLGFSSASLSLSGDPIFSNEWTIVACYAAPSGGFGDLFWQNGSGTSQQGISIDGHGFAPVYHDDGTNHTPVGFALFSTNGRFIVAGTSILGQPLTAYEDSSTPYATVNASVSLGLVTPTTNIIGGHQAVASSNFSLYQIIIYRSATLSTDNYAYLMDGLNAQYLCF